MLRKAKPQDIPAVVDLAIESVTTVSPIPSLDLNIAAIRDTAEICLRPAHFLWVSEIDGEIVGAVGAQVSPSYWHRGLQCSVLMHYSRAPGEWVKLMRRLGAWVESRSGIKTAVIELEPKHNDDPRVGAFLSRLGFGRASQNLVYVRPDK